MTFTQDVLPRALLAWLAVLSGCSGFSVNESTPLPNIVKHAFAMATVVSEQGEAITAHHFTRHCQKFVAISVDNRVHQAQWVTSDPNKDLALIHIGGVHSNSSWSADLSYESDHSSYFYNLRMGAGNLPIVTKKVTGNLVEPPTGFDAQKFARFTGPIEIGNSGSGVFNQYGELTGMAVAALIPAYLGGVALKVEAIQPFLDRHYVSFHPASLQPMVLECVQ